MYIFDSNSRTNVGTTDTPMDIEYESSDSQAIIEYPLTTELTRSVPISVKIQAGVGPFFLACQRC